MAKFYELLAVAPNLKSQAEKLKNELIATFTKKQHLFGEKIVVSTPIEEGGIPKTESQSKIESEVNKELRWLGNHLASAVDVEFQIGKANQVAKADVVLDDGEILLSNVPATVLLELEKRLVTFLEVVAALPTLDPAKGFEPDPARGVGYYKALPVEKIRTKKSKEVLELAPASEKHPRQVQVLDVDVPAANVKEQEWSSMITVSRKAEIFAKAEMIQRAIKKARSRANDIEVNTDLKIGKTLTDAVFGL